MAFQRQMTAQIVKHYQIIAAGLEGERHRLTKHPWAIELGGEATQMAVRDIRSVIKQRPAFFKDHDYRWATRIDSYRNQLEATLQLYVLTAISDIARDHPHYQLLGNICVRVSAVGGANATSFQSGDFKYAVMSSGLLKMLWEFLHTFDEVYPNPNRYSETPGNEKSAFQWTQEQAIQISIYKTAELDRLIDSAAAYANFSVPRAITARYPDGLNVDNPMLAYASRIVAAADAFIALHEVGHLLAHGTLNRPRSLLEEAQADSAALSLMLILAARMPVLGAVYFGGVALAYATMRYANLVGRTFRQIESLRSGAPFDEQQEGIFEDELFKRSHNVSNFIVSAGLPRSLSSTFDRFSRELFILTEATKLRLIHSLGVGQ